MYVYFGIHAKHAFICNLYQPNLPAELLAFKQMSGALVVVCCPVVVVVAVATGAAVVVAGCAVVVVTCATVVAASTRTLTMHANILGVILSFEGSEFVFY